MNRRQNAITQIVMLLGSVVAIAAYFFKYFSLPIISDIADAFLGTDLGLGNLSVITILQMCQQASLDEPPVIIAIILLFGLPVLLLLINIILQIIALIKENATKAAGITGVIAGVYLLITNLFIGIILKIASDGAANELVGEMSSFMPDIYTVGPMWWVQLAMTVIILAGAIVLLVTTKDSSAGGAPKPEDVALIGVKGQYAGCVFKIKGDDRFILGRDAAVCNVVFSESESKISRRHCEIHYNYDSEKYIVTDYSSNGTYVTNGKQKNKLPQGKPMQVAAQFYLEIGNDRNVFKLN